MRGLRKKPQRKGGLRIFPLEVFLSLFILSFFLLPFHPRRQLAIARHSAAQCLSFFLFLLPSFFYSLPSPPTASHRPPLSSLMSVCLSFLFSCFLLSSPHAATRRSLLCFAASETCNLIPTKPTDATLGKDFQINTMKRRVLRSRLKRMCR